MGPIGEETSDVEDLHGVDEWRQGGVRRRHQLDGGVRRHRQVAGVELGDVPVRRGVGLIE